MTDTATRTDQPTTPETPKPGPPPAAQNVGTETPVTLPDDHPLVTALATLKAENKALKESSKSETERVAERLADVEKRAVEAEARVLRRDVALEFQLSKDDAALLDKITDEDAMRALAERLSVESGKQHSNVVPREGNTPTPGSDPMREFTRSLFADRD